MLNYKLLLLLPLNIASQNNINIRHLAIDPNIIICQETKNNISVPCNLKVFTRNHICICNFFLSYRKFPQHILSKYEIYNYETK